MKKTLIEKTLIGLAFGLAANLALAFPDKPVHIVVPYPAGGATDAAARIVAERLTQAWGQPVLVENRPGAAGVIGTDYVAKSASDGYTLLFQVPHMLATELIRPSVSYRTLRDFVPVTNIFTTPVVYVASDSAPAGGLNEILAAAKASPGAINYGHSGEGTTTSYMGEKLKKVTGVQMTAVPYSGDGTILTALLGGHLHTGFLSGLSAKRAVELGRARIIAVTSAQRSPLLPDAPTFLEQGVEGFDRGSWAKAFAPAGTPAVIVDKLARDISSVVQSKDVQERFQGLGLVGIGGTPAETLKDVQDEYANWVRLIEEFGAMSKP